VATPVLAPFTVLLGLVVLRKQRKFALFFSFAVPAVLLLLYIGSVLQDQQAGAVAKDALLSWPIIFFGSIMLTEPSTLPPTRYYQLLFGALTGFVFASQLHVGIVSATPQAALLVGNLFTLVAAPAAGAMLRLKRISQLAPNLYDVVFERPKRIRFAPGQYLEWTLPHHSADARGNRRTFSIASSPTEPDLHIGVKTYQPSSTFKRALLALKPGALIRAAHVAGNFTLPLHTNKPLVFIVGGIGITPFRSMLKYLADTKEQHDITLLYIANSEADFIYKDVLQQAEAIGLKTRYIISRAEEDTLRDYVPLLQRGLAYISGPDAMVSHYKRMLTSLGVARSSIKTDHFTGY
jgi:ferredoxin-NADP reductase